MAAFRVVDDWNRTILETDDWVDAQAAAMCQNWPPKHILYVRGVHPTHAWGDRHCTVCGAWKNGSYGSQAPCGYDWGHSSLAGAVERELAARKESQ